MKGKSPSDYVKTVYISDLFYDVLDKLLVVILIGVLSFLAIFAPSYIKTSKAKAEPPGYIYTVDVQVFSEFESNSLLSSAAVVMEPKSIEKLVEYEKLEFTPEEVRHCITYNMEGGNIIRFNVHAKDEDTSIRVMAGIIDVIVPMIKENTGAKYCLYSFSEGDPRMMKVLDEANDGQPGVFDVIGKRVLLWDEYLEKEVGFAHILKNSIVAGCFGVFVTVMAIVFKRLLSRNMNSLTEVEAASGKSVLAVVDNKGEGIENLIERAKDAAGGMENLCVIPIRNTPVIEAAVTSMKETVDTDLSVADSLADSASRVELCKKEGKKALILLEDAKTKDLELINSVDILENAGVPVIGTAVINIKEKKLKRMTEYFGKYYK